MGFLATSVVAARGDVADETGRAVLNRTAGLVGEAVVVRTGNVGFDVAVAAVKERFGGAAPPELDVVTVELAVGRDIGALNIINIINN